MSTHRSMADVTIEIPILKVDAEERLITGIVLEPDTIDAQNDTVPPHVIKKAAYKFLSTYNKSTKMGLMHEVFGAIGVELVESYIAPIDFELNGQQITKGSWLMTVHITSDDLWARVKNGEITGFSIGGTATVPAA
jgi:DNA adenine methylase